MERQRSLELFGQITIVSVLALGSVYAWHAYARMCVHTHTQTHAHKHMHAHTQCMHTDMHTCTHAHRHTCTHTCTETHMHMGTQINSWGFILPYRFRSLYKAKPSCSSFMRHGLPSLTYRIFSRSFLRIYLWSTWSSVWFNMSKNSSFLYYFIWKPGWIYTISYA